MSKISVGIREFKAKLSSYMQDVKAGKTLVITERGKPVGHVIPTSSSVKDRMLELVDAGFMSWNQKKIRVRMPKLRLKGKGKTMAELLLEDRE